MVKKFFFFCIYLYPTVFFCQQETLFTTIKKNLHGSFESNAMWYQNDEELRIVHNENTFRANSYLNLNYNFFKNFTAGVQVESYEPISLQNYYKGYEKTNISNFFLNYKTDKVSFDLGHFYEQFGNGLILRSFEERSLGLNNALKGAKFEITPFPFVTTKLLYGKNRHGFETAESEILGADIAFNVSDIIKSDNFPNVNLEFSYVNRNQPYDDTDVKGNNVRGVRKIRPRGRVRSIDNFPIDVNAFSYRANIDFGNFYTNFEYATKGEEVVLLPSTRLYYRDRYFKGNGLIFTTGYTKKGMGVSATFRRLENMEFFARRDFYSVRKNQYRMLSLNYLPSLAKQFSYSLANIYLYSAQPGFSIDKYNARAGEIGGLVDFYYTFKKGTTLGGKYGTKVNANFSHWSLLKATFDNKDISYSSEFFDLGKKLNVNYNIGISKKWNKRLKSNITYINSAIDKGVTKGGILGVYYVNYDVLATDVTLKFKGRKSLKVDLQHLWTADDTKNWYALGVEFNFNKNISIYANNMNNYESEKIDYFNVGATYNIDNIRLALNYGRQRGGLMCAGGVCRYVDGNSGLGISINTFF